MLTTLAERKAQERCGRVVIVLFVFCRELREQEEFVDVTLACEGQQVSAHKVVLSACSPYFRSLLKVSAGFRLTINPASL